MTKDGVRGQFSGYWDASDDYSVVAGVGSGELRSLVDGFPATVTIVEPDFASWAAPNVAEGDSVDIQVPGLGLIRAIVTNVREDGDTRYLMARWSTPGADA